MHQTPRYVWLNASCAHGKREVLELLMKEHRHQCQQPSRPPSGHPLAVGAQMASCHSVTAGLVKVGSGAHSSLDLSQTNF